MKIAVEGCCHGELDKIYETVQHLEKENSIKVDLLLICGDFQAVRNKSDMQCMAVPPKYQRLNTFYKYYSGEKTAPVLTIFIGGNHEASNFMQELLYGGWVAPNIYYMGYASVVKIGGLRIAGLSGIYKGKDFHKGHFEHLPYDDSTKRSVYHVRNLEIFRLKQISRPIDIFLSHDWPRGIYNYGNTNMLLRKKSFLEDEIKRGVLGSLPAEELLHHLKPAHWFSAHLHVKFAALVQHQPEDNVTKTTKFLSLDKCLPKRKFLQVIDIPHDINQPIKLQLDPEWLCILKSTNHLLNLGPIHHYMPGPGSPDRWNFKVTDQDCESITKDFDGVLTMPENFEKTAPAHNNSTGNKTVPHSIYINPQTNLICTMLDLTDPNAVLLGKDSRYSPQDIADANVNQPDDDDDDEDDDDDDDVCSDINSSVDTSDTSLNDASNDTSLLLGDTSLNLTGSADISVSGEDDVQKVLLQQKMRCVVSNVSSSDDVSMANGDDDDELATILAAQKKHRLSVDQINSVSSPGTSNHDDSNNGDSSALKSLENSISQFELEKSMDIESQNSSLEEDKNESNAVLSAPESLLSPPVCSSVKEKVMLAQSVLSAPDTVLPAPIGSSVEEGDILAQSGLSPPVDSSSRAPSEDEGTPKSAGSKRTDNSSDVEISPMTKKLKRRNQNVYSSSEGDGES